MAGSRTMPAALQTEIGAMASVAGVAGLSIAVVARGETFTGAYGRATPTAEVTVDTPFSVASSGKHMTAAAVIKLASAGRLDLDAPIGGILDDLPSAWASRSVRSLLHHTSGLPEYLERIDAIGPITSRLQFMRACDALPPHFDEQAAWSYSNTNYVLLGFAIADLTGQPYGTAIEQLLMGSAGLSGVAVGGPDWANAHAGSTSPRAWSGADPDHADLVVAGDGDLVVSATGALAWHRALFHGGALTRSEADTRADVVSFTSGRPVCYASGWFVDSIDGRQCLNHAGHFGGYSAFFFVLPEIDVAAYVMMNAALGSTRVPRTIAMTALERIVPGTTPFGQQVLDDDDPALTTLARRALLREADPIDPRDFAPELQTVIRCVHGPRGGLNLWCGQAPSRFELVQRDDFAGCTFRRYRITYPTHVDHVRVGHAPDGTIFWAWPM